MSAALAQVLDQHKVARQAVDLREKDRPLVQTLELVCDGIAILTLRRAGIDSKRLAGALEKVIRYNRAKLGAARNEDNYPPIGRAPKICRTSRRMA